MNCLHLRYNSSNMTKKIGLLLLLCIGNFFFSFSQIKKSITTTKISELESELESNIVDVLQTNNIKKNFILDAELELEN